MNVPTLAELSRLRRLAVPKQQEHLRDYIKAVDKFYADKHKAFRRRSLRSREKAVAELQGRVAALEEQVAHHLATLGKFYERERECWELPWWAFFRKWRIIRGVERGDDE